MKVLYLYDFDGTLTPKDTLFDFLRFSIPKIKYQVGKLLFLPLFGLTFLGVVSRAEAKRRFISYFLRGKSREELRRLSIAYKSFFFNDRNLYKTAFQSIEENKKKGELWIVSASLDIWLKDIAKELGLNLICTQAHFNKNLFDGTFATPNCNYSEKPKRVNQEIDLHDFTEIHYYGDSKGDWAMKSLVSHFHYREFKS